jgi:hypothetical protein
MFQGIKPTSLHHTISNCQGRLEMTSTSAKKNQKTAPSAKDTPEKRANGER